MMSVRPLTSCEPYITVYYETTIILDEMEFESFSEFYDKLNAYCVDKPGKKPPTKNGVQLMIEEILAAKIKM